MDVQNWNWSRPLFVEWKSSGPVQFTSIPNSLLKSPNFQTGLPVLYILCFWNFDIWSKSDHSASFVFFGHEISSLLATHMKGSPDPSKAILLGLINSNHSILLWIGLVMAGQHILRRIYFLVWRSRYIYKQRPYTSTGMSSLNSLFD